MSLSTGWDSLRSPGEDVVAKDLLLVQSMMAKTQKLGSNVYSVAIVKIQKISELRPIG